MLLIDFRDTRPLIAHENGRISVIDFPTKRDCTTIGGILNGVANEVIEDLS